MNQLGQLRLLANAALSRWFCNEEFELPSISNESLDKLPDHTKRMWEVATSGCPRDTAVMCARSGLSAASVGAVIGEFYQGTSDGVRRELLAIDKQVRISSLARQLGTGEIGAADLISSLGRVATSYQEVNISEWRKASGCQWIVNGFLQSGCLTVLSAVGGVGKSLLSLDLMIRVASGDTGKWLDTFDLPSTPQRVMILDAECGPARINRRIRELVEGGAFPAEIVDLATNNMVIYSVGSGSGDVTVQDIPLLVAQHRPCVLLVDPLRCFLPKDIEDENANLAMGRAMDRFVNFSQQLNISILLVAHSNRAAQPLRGASASRDSTEFLWDLTVDGDGLKLACDKSRDPVPVSEVNLRIVTSPKSDGISPVRFESSGGASTESAGTKRVRVYLAQNGESGVRQIITDLGMARSSVREALNWLHKHGAVNTRMDRSAVLYSLVE